MKKVILKGLVFCLTFCASVFIISRILNKGNNDLTVEMPAAVFPVVYINIEGVNYNELHGYADKMDTSYMRDTITVLNEDRSTGFCIDTFEQKINTISYEIRSVDGERLIEKTEVQDFEQSGNTIKGSMVIKDLIDKNTEYEMIIILKTDRSGEINYYTRLVWGTDYYALEKLDFVKQFHKKTFNKEEVNDLVRYMETNKEGDNTTLNKVNIHCNIDQLSWGKLDVVQETEEVFNFRELSSQIANLSATYLVSAKEEGKTKYFNVVEEYRIRYTQDRIYLLDYERTMTSILNCKDDIYVNDKILLGVADENTKLVESEDGNVFAFVHENSLYTYNVVTNKMSVVFSFYDDCKDVRTLYDQHNIKIMSIDEGGNIQFIVYGYMNRGWHEGEVGIQIFSYDSTMNTIEEIMYIPYDKTYQILDAEINEVLYLNPENHLFLTLGDCVYDIDLLSRKYEKLIDIHYDNSVMVSDNHKMLVFQKNGDYYHSSDLQLMDLMNSHSVVIEASEDEYIMPLGFMEEDLVYGIAKKEDVHLDHTGRTFFPMYEVVIESPRGEVLKTYRQDNVYVTECILQQKQITLNRMIKNENGIFIETTPDQIMNSVENIAGKNEIKIVTTENYGKYVQIQVKKDINSKTIQVRNPKQVLFEGGRNLELQQEEIIDKYYVFGLNGIENVYRSPAKAVQMAEKVNGVVVNEQGTYIWKKENRVTKNQIMAIQANDISEEKDSLTVCLDTILKYEGVIRNTEFMLKEGDSAIDILSDNIEEARILDLTGCSLDAVLYYVNKDIPVLATLKDGTTVLIVGFNQYNIAIMDPNKGTIEKAGMNDSAELFLQNGNSFITYSR